jgi:hypothetical protein
MNTCLGAESLFKGNMGWKDGERARQARGRWWRAVRHIASPSRPERQATRPRGAERRSSQKLRIRAERRLPPHSIVCHRSHKRIALSSKSLSSSDRLCEAHSLDPGSSRARSRTQRNREAPSFRLPHDGERALRPAGGVGFPGDAGRAGDARVDPYVRDGHWAGSPSRIPCSRGTATQRILREHELQTQERQGRGGLPARWLPRRLSRWRDESTRAFRMGGRSRPDRPEMPPRSRPARIAAWNSG